jgi:hypothetical protein
MHAFLAFALQAGPGTIAEALIRGLPIILNDFIPGQVSASVCCFSIYRGIFSHPLLLHQAAVSLIWFTEITPKLGGLTSSTVCRSLESDSCFCFFLLPNNVFFYLAQNCSLTISP